VLDIYARVLGRQAAGTRRARHQCR
jgi:hypothetical protein